MACSDTNLVSIDFWGEVCTIVFGAEAGMALGSTLIKVMAQYDNE